MNITKAIKIIKAYGNSVGTTDILETLRMMPDDEYLSNLERCAYNLFMYEGRKMFESVKIKVEVGV